VYGQVPSFMPPGAAAPAPGGGRTGGMVALVVGSVVLLLVLVGVGVALFLRSDSDDPPAPAAPTAQASAAGEAEYPARIELPQTLAGMSKIDDEDLNALANEIANDLKTSTDAETAYVAYYAPAGEATKIVGVIGATGKMERPGTELDDMFTEMSVTGIAAVDPGPMGGHMKCGIQETATQRLTICGWADGGSLGLGIFLDRPMSESEILFRQIRGEVLKRG
jgi:hypothetical protein